MFYYFKNFITLRKSYAIYSSPFNKIIINFFHNAVYYLKNTYHPHFLIKNDFPLLKQNHWLVLICCKKHLYKFYNVKIKLKKQNATKNCEILKRDASS